MGYLSRKFCGLGAAAFLIGSALLSAQAPRSAPQRVLGSISDAQLTPLRGNAAISHMALSDLGAIDGDTRSERMILQLNPSDSQKAELAALIEAQSDPKSPMYHKWLTPAEFGSRFGIAQSDLDKVTTWLTQQGFHVDQVPAGRQTVVFSGTVAQVANAFHTQLHRYQMNSTTPIANDGNPQVPSALAPVIAGFASLSNNRRKPMLRNVGTFILNSQTHQVTPKSTSTNSISPLDADTAGSGKATPDFTYTSASGSTLELVAPYDFATIYNLKPMWAQGYDGTGQTIAIISPSDLNQSDVDSFRAQFGLPATKMNKIYSSVNPGITANVDETALDVEWSGAVAKGATIDLIVGASSLVTDGLDEAALYAVNNNIAPIISVSYGECEAYLGASGNAYYNALWEQAAAQGQSVFISSGDSGATTCDAGNSAATKGITVNGLGSTPYNVSVGGTDLYGTHTARSTYWNTTNDSNLANAKSYIPESPWNDSCGNPLILSALVAQKGYTDQSTAALCNNKLVTTSNYRQLVGGGGGASNCIATTDGTIATCTGGYAQPSWQKGVGVPANGLRNLPDVSLMSGDGIWGSFIPFCLAQGLNSGSCDLSNTANVLGGGGTSFAAPQFAGILAIVNQKMNAPQGNPNPIFYAMAAKTSSLNCSSTDPAASTSCIFHDVQVGGNAEPCYALNSTGVKDCVTSVAGNTFGVTSGNASTVGYDMATGLGSVDITNLVNAWPSAVSAQNSTTTTLSLNSTTAVYGVGPTATVKVTATSGTPTGDFSVLPSSTAVNAAISSPGTLSNGAGTLPLPLLPVGTYAVHAHYAGDTGFNASDSAAQTITITQAATQTAISVTRATLTSSQSTSLQVTIMSTGAGNPPTGQVHFVNTTSGLDLGTFALTSNATSPAFVALNVSPAQLLGGSNTLTATYSGDSNYAGSSQTATVTLSAPLALSLSNSSVTLTTTGTTVSASTNVSVTAANGGALAYPIALSCTGTLPSGAACTLTNAVLTSASPAAVATVTYTQPLSAQSHLPAVPWRYGLVSSLAGVVMLFSMRRPRMRGAALFTTMLGVFLLGVFLLGISGCSNHGSAPTPTASVTLSPSSSSTSYGSSVTFTSTITANSTSTGVVSLTDTYHGATRTIGSINITNNTGSFTTTTLGIGAHSVLGVFNGYPNSVSSSPANVQVTSTSTLLVKATDANGITVVSPLTVVLQ